MQIPFFSFRDFPGGLTQQVEEALVQELRQQRLILGPTVTAFEQEFAQLLGEGEVIGVGNGYDALVLCLKALGIGPGQEVVVPSNGYIATVNAVMQVGATPVFAEPDGETYNMTAATVTAVLTGKTKAILPIHLYGQSCELTDLLHLTQKQNLYLLEDFAQAHGATYKGRRVGTFGQINATSFYPTKNMGAAGDGGAVTTQDPALANWVRQHHNYGQQEQYVFAQVGINSRLDSLQAAVLRVKLKVLDQLNHERQRLGQRYHIALANVGDLVLPLATREGVDHVYHLYVIRTAQRDQLQAFLQNKGIGTLIHYPVPPHLQPAYRHLGFKPGAFPVAENLAKTCLSLPLFPGLSEAEQDYIITQIEAFFRR
ncbi:DegT/DnrJ/EryC1/StrS aminotransferase family protein [Rufibacter sp. LB8]|uniref:DegT/DnrJ/EryC1/StrS family aminotransferase n=1 Tax=Rufibacter sp. LB8 TaxID=2777781 RepID=UPI00178C19F8|nr:DegT/DnrJ/EryC1/StrS family aminotransferase [Rufibacter sp. LB8]